MNVLPLKNLNVNVLLLEKLNVNVFLLQHTESTPGILSCHGMRQFWVSWDGGYVALGVGLYRDSMIFSFNDTDPFTIATVSVGMNVPKNEADRGRNGEFSFPRPLGK